MMPSSNRRTRLKSENEMVSDRRRATRTPETKRSEERLTRRSSNETKQSPNLKLRLHEKFTEMLEPPNQNTRSSRAAKRKQDDIVKEEPAPKKCKKAIQKPEVEVIEISDSESETSSSDTETSDDDSTKPSDDESRNSRDYVEETSNPSTSCKEVVSMGDDDNEDSRSVVSRKSDSSSSLPTSSLGDERALDGRLGKDDDDWNLEEELQAEGNRSRTRVRRRGATKRKRSSQSEDSSIENVHSARRMVIQTRNGIVFQVNGKLEAMDFQDKWYPAKIIDVDNTANEILIHFQQWNSRYDEWVPMDSPRLRAMAHPSTRREFQQSKNRKNIHADFKVGEAVLARWTDCRLYQAHIKEVLSDGNYEVIFYDGFQRKLGPMNILKFTEGGERYKTMEPCEFKAVESDVKKEIENDDSCSAGKPEIVAPKEFVVEEDHNQFKCPEPECTKGFRKEALLQSHIKHYHSGDRFIPRRHRKISVSSVVSDSMDIIAEKSDADSLPGIQKSKDFLLQPELSQEKTSMVTIEADIQEDSLSSEVQLELANELVQELQAIANTPEDSVQEEMMIDLPVICAVPKVEDEMESAMAPPTERVEVEGKDFTGIKEEQPLAVLPPLSPPKMMPLRRLSKKTYPVTKMETRHAKLCFFKEDFSYLKEAKYLKSSGHRGEAIGRTQKGFVGKQGVPKRSKSKEGDGETKKRSPSGKTEKKSENITTIKSEPAYEEEASTEFQPTFDEALGKGLDEPSVSTDVETPPVDDEVVKCICECNDENGLMIQCEVCMAWQHGICFDIEDVEQVPEKYICYLCTEPQGLRKSFRYKYDQDWFKKGELATFGFLKEDPRVASQAEAILATHDLTSSIHDINNVLHSLQHNINIIQSENSPELKYWSKARTTNGSVDSLKCEGSVIVPGAEDGPSFLANDFGPASPAPKNFTTFDHSYFSPKQDSVVAMLTGPQEFAAEAVVCTSPFDIAAAENECSQEGQVPNAVALDHGYAEEVGEGGPGDSQEGVKVDAEMCKRNLTEHVRSMQQEVSEHLDAVEELLDLLEVEAGSEDSFQGSGDADDFQELMKSIRNLSQDLHTVQRFTRYQ